MPCWRSWKMSSLRNNKSKESAETKKELMNTKIIKDTSQFYLRDSLKLIKELQSAPSPARSRQIRKNLESIAEKMRFEIRNIDKLLEE